MTIKPEVTISDIFVFVYQFNLQPFCIYQFYRMGTFYDPGALMTIIAK